MNMNDELNKKLALWKVQPEIPPGFQRGVWNRIAARETKSSKNLLGGLLAIPWLTLPRVAACAFAVSVFTGAGLGLLESASANTQSWKTLEAKYVQSIDPYQRLGTD
jgi:hypothetical protein